MNSTGEKIKNIAAIIALLMIVSVAAIVMVPFIIISLPFSVCGRRRFDAAYTEFLHRNEGKTFFVYTNKKRTLAFLEQQVVPLISPEIGIVLLEGKKVKAGSDSRFFQKLLYAQRTAGGFPWLIKIVQARPMAISVNNKLYQAIDHNDPQILLESVIAFSM